MTIDEETQKALRARAEALSQRYRESGFEILEAYEFAYAKHEGQVRDSKEPYIEHPLRVAEMVADLEMDPASVAAALLHDVVEDTSASLLRLGAARKTCAKY